MGWLKKLGKGTLAVVRNPLGKAAIGLLPAGPLINTILGSVLAVEQEHQLAGRVKSGAEKHANVIDDFDQYFAPIQAYLRTKGKIMTFSGDARDRLIRAQVEVLNAAQALQDSMSESDLVLEDN